MLDAFRRPERLRQFVLACHADAIGRKGFENRPYPQAEFLFAAHAAASQISGKAIIDRRFTGSRVGELMHEQRTNVVKNIKKAWDSDRA